RAFFGYDDAFVLPKLNSGIFPAFKAETLEENDDFVVHRDERGIVKRDRRDRGSMPEFLAYPVTNRDDWEELKARRLRIDRPGRVAEDWPVFRSHVEETGKAVQVGVFPFGVFGTARDLLGVEALLTGFYDDPGLIHDIMDHLTALWISLWQQVAAEVQIDHIHIWEDMAGRQGSLISPAMVEDFMMPCYDRIAAFGRSAGVRLISVDTDGQCAELVPVMMRHGVNMLLPFEVQAGNDVLRYRDQYPELGIEGGLDKRAPAQSREAVDREVERAREMVKRGRYIPGFDHLVPPDVPWDTFRYAAERLREVCYKGG
ncbi:uroporphyrinogen decarboxylase family protein, partial [Verrucomicrobiota bacterium]